MESYLQNGMDLIIAYAPKLLMALVVLFIGLRVIKFLVKLLSQSFVKRNLDPTLRPFIAGLVGWSLKIMLFISVMSMTGVATTSFIAVLGATGLAIGLALQGSLANFAGGFLILTLRPFKVGDKIESQGRVGVVKEIQLLATILSAATNETIILPNAGVMNNDIVNFTTQGKVRADLSIGISYDSDIKVAKRIILETLARDPKVLEDPKPAVGVKELADSAVNLVVMPWCEPGDYWAVHFNSLEQCKASLEEAGVKIPFPQVDVHMS